MFDNPIELYMAYISLSLIIPFILGEFEPLFHILVTIFIFIVLLIIDFSL